jgi:hypothetical protein
MATRQKCIDFSRTYFDGETYDPELDKARLGVQVRAVRALMLDGEWRTLAEIAGLVHAPEASVSARLRDLRKPRFGAMTVERRRRGEGQRGLWEYRVKAGARVS